MDGSKTEEWRLIHFGFYEVSSLGNIRRAKSGIATFIGRPVRPQAGGTGYSMVSLSGDKARRAYVHHLVAEAFLGPRTKIVNHKDGNKLNNRLENLEYVTHQENCAHAINTIPRQKGPTKPKLPRKGKPTGDNHWSHRRPDLIARGNAMPHCKLSEDIVRSVRERVSNGEMQKEIAAEVGISVAQMSRIIRRKRWVYVK